MPRNHTTLIREFYEKRPLLEERFLGLLVAATKHNPKAMKSSLFDMKGKYGFESTSELNDAIALATEKQWVVDSTQFKGGQMFALTEAGKTYYQDNLANAEPKPEVEVTVHTRSDPPKPYTHIRKQTSNNRGTGLFDFYKKLEPAQRFVGLLESRPTKSCMISSLDRAEKRYALMDAETFHAAGQAAADKGWVEVSAYSGGTKYTLTGAGQDHNKRIKERLEKFIQSGRGGSPTMAGV